MRFTEVTEEGISGGDHFDERVCFRAARMHLHTRANGAAIRGAAFEPERYKLPCARGVVLEEADARTVAIGDPQVEVAVAVPIAAGDDARIVWQVEATGGGDVGKLARPQVQEAAIPLIAGVITSAIHTLVLIPVYYTLYKRFEQWRGRRRVA